jgi:hypothetical protein
MAGCIYCGKMHSPLYVCDEAKQATPLTSEASPTSPTASPTIECRGWARNARWREKNRERYNAYMRQYRKARGEKLCRLPEGYFQ